MSTVNKTHSCVEVVHDNSASWTFLSTLEFCNTCRNMNIHCFKNRKLWIDSIFNTDMRRNFIVFQHQKHFDDWSDPSGLIENSNISTYHAFKWGIKIDLKLQWTCCSSLEEKKSQDTVRYKKWRLIRIDIRFVTFITTKKMVKSWLLIWQYIACKTFNRRAHVRNYIPYINAATV